jgi:protein O-GlcNAc transferase
MSKQQNSFINMFNQYEKLSEKDLAKKIDELYKNGLGYFKEKEVIKAEKFFNQILELTPEHKESELYLAKLNIHKGDYETAINLLKKYLSHEPNSFDAKLRLSTAYNKVKNYEGSIGVLIQLKNTLTDIKQLSKVKDNLIKTYYAQASSFKENKNYKKAISAYEQAAKIEKNEEKKLLNFASCYKEMKNYAKATEYLNEVLKINEKSDNFDIYFQLGNIEEIQGNNGRAIRVYQKFVELNPDNQSNNFFKAKIYLLQKNYDKAIEFFNKAIKTEKNLREAHYELANVYSMQKYYNEALTNYLELLNIGKETPDVLINIAKMRIKIGEEKKVPEILEKLGGIPLEENPEIAGSLGELLLELGFINEARQNLIMAKEMLPDDPEVRVYLSQCFKISGDSEEAENELQAGLKMAPNNFLIQKEIAQNFKEKSKPESALEIYNKMLSVDPRDKEPLKLIAELHLENKNYKEAISNYKEYLLTFKNDAEAIYNLGLCYFEIIDMNNAAKEFEKLTNNPKYCFFAFSFLVNIYISKGNMNKAMEFLQKSIQNFPTFSDNYLKYGKICIHIGQVPRAIEYFNYAKGLEPENPEVNQLLSYYGK